jgi:sterol desaturase/sphingolipid hydroxylase (fatty acid hydroxylase superfamily)
MGPTLGGLIAGFTVVGALLWPIERLWPARPGQRLLREGLGTDLCYWVFTPFVTRTLTRIGVIGAVLGVALAAGVPLDREHVQAWLLDPGRAVRRQSIGLQVLEVLLIGDLVGYWAHRAFHGRRLWPFHAVHHGSKQLDWLSAVRVHPVNDLASRVVSALPVLLLGFSPMILAGYVPFLAFYAILLHANVRWTFGPLRYLIASPAFHRWHHTSQDEGRDRNFAGLFPFLDLAFGTFFMPRDRQAERFGLGPGGADMPGGLLAQLAYPFRRP